MNKHKGSHSCLLLEGFKPENINGKKMNGLKLAVVVIEI